MSLAKGLSVLFVFSKNHLLVLSIFTIVSFISFSFISAWIFIISFLVLILGLFVLLFPVVLGVKLGCLFDVFLVSRGKIRRRQWHPTPVLLPRKSHGWRSLVGCSPWSREEPDTTERLHFHFSLSCIGEGNGNPLQCSCLENPRDGAAWWAAIYGVTQSWTRLKQLSSSSSSIVLNLAAKTESHL